MIYVPAISAAVPLAIPRTLAGSPADPAIVLINTTDRCRYEVPVADFDAAVLYYLLRADFSAVDVPGEYEYHLTGEGREWASGILRVGDIPNPQSEIYETAPVYEQYNAD